VTESNLGDELVDDEELAAFCRRELGPAETDHEEPLTAQRHQAGYSNETLFVRWGERELVLRRPPLGETAESAHDVLREARVMDGVDDTSVPVPEIVATCSDRSVLGCDFLLMERLAGDVIRESEPDRFAEPDHRHAVGERLVDTLVDIHAVDYERVGLGDFGKPTGYLERQVDTFTQQLEEWLLPMTEHDREVPHIREVGSWLAENVPTESDHTLVHGDYKLDNVMFGPGTPPEIVGVFDWELSTLGDPLADIGWMLLFWRDEKDSEPILPSELVPTFMEEDGYHTRTELVRRYENETDRTFTNERFYRGLAAYKIATTCEAMYARYLSGKADDPMYPALEEGVPELAARAKRIVDGEQPI